MASVETLTIEELGSFLSEKNVDEEVIDNFKKNKVSGASFVKMTGDDLNDLIPSIGLRPEVRAILRRVRRYECV